MTLVNSRNNVAGFTMVELMLAMTFVSVLLVAIAMVTIQLSHIYNKGLTLREVNQVGRSLSEDIQRSISMAVPFNVDTSSPLTRYISKPGGGRICTGRYSYVWNYGKAIVGGAGAPVLDNHYDDGTVVIFAKVDDSSAALCINPSSSVPKASSTEMLSAGDRDLAVHSFTVSNVANDSASGQALYGISFIIGTNDQSQLLTDNTSCKPPSSNVGNEDYCSVNQFDIVVRAGNKSGGDQ